MQNEESSRRAFISLTREMMEHPARPATMTFLDAALEACRRQGLQAVYMKDFCAEDLPVAEIDERNVRSCAVFIALIGLRYGTPVRDLPEMSYTQHEFMAATKARKEGVVKARMAFLLDENVVGLPASATRDPEYSDRQDAFRKHVQDECGNCPTFQNPDELLRLVEDALRQYRENADDDDDQLAGEEATIPGEYLDWLRDECKDIRLLGGLQLNRDVRPPLSHVYVPLTTSDARLGWNAVEAELPPGEELWRGGEEKSQTLILDLLARQSLYVSGDAGTGKSTFCRWVSLLAASGGQFEQDVEADEEFRETFPDAFRDKLPVWVELRKFWESLPRGDHRGHFSPGQLEEALGAWLERRCGGRITADNVATHFRGGSVLLILDGMDEAPTSHQDERQTWHPRLMLLDALAKAVPAWELRGARVLLTSRPYGLDEDDKRRLALRQARIADLPDELQMLLIRRWFRILEEGRGESAAQDMIAELRSRPEIKPLVANPMFLSAMCVLFGSEGKQLPEDLHELYHRVVENVLHNRFPKDSNAKDEARRRLAVVAYGMHTGEYLGKDWDDPVAEVSYEDIELFLLEYRKDQEGEPSDAAAAEIREQLLSRTGLLVPRGERRASFYHLSIQEFLAAEWLLREARRRRQDFPAIFTRRAKSDNWCKTLLFAFGLLQGNAITQPDAQDLVKRMIDILSPQTAGRTLPLQLVIADALQILTRKNMAVSRKHIDKFRDFCRLAIEHEAPLHERFRLAIALGELGDPRIAKDLRRREGPLAYVRIPAGPYWLGDEKEPWELEQPYLLSKYPVTNSQYELFMAGGYENREFWSEEGWQWREKEHVTEPRLWRDPKWNNLSQPVVGVSYWEAEAFCRWAGGRLPSQHEWEAAARGPNGLYYPWGEESDWEDDICNSRHAGLEVTSPVGIFPRSASKDFGLEDMAGNVWEWCSHVEPALWDSDDPNGRAVRGGSWFIPRAYCRAAHRYAYQPGDRGYNLGFRVWAAVQ